MTAERKKPSITLVEAKRLTPAVDPVEAMRRQLHLALFGGLTEGDMVACAKALKGAALDGDMRAMRLLLDLVTRFAGAPAGPSVHVQQAVAVNGRTEVEEDRGPLSLIDAYRGPAVNLPAPIHAEPDELSATLINLIAAGGPDTASNLAACLNRKHKVVATALTSQWFEEDDGRHRLSAAGQRIVNAAKEESP